MIGQRLRDSLQQVRSSGRLSRPRRSLRRRIVIGNVVIGVLLLAAGSIVALQVGRLLAAVDTLQEARHQVDAAVNVRQQSTGLMVAVTRLLPAEDAVQFPEEVAARLDDLKASQQNMLTIADSIDDPLTAAALETVDGEVTNVTNIADTMVRQAQAEQWHSVTIRVGLLNRDQQQVLDAVDALLRRTQSLEANAEMQVVSARRAVIIYPSIVFLFTLIFGASLVTQVIRGITRPVERLTEGASRLAAGAFDERVQVEGDDEIGQLAQTFNSMADQLQSYYRSLEERVAERTRALETSLQVSRRLSRILDQETLTHEVVDQVQKAFNYYHVHIYLFDIGRQYLLMVGGTGEAGRAMLLRGHRLKAGQGLVGRTASRNEVTLIPDITEEPDWLPNPLLPDTRSELAVPITFDGKVHGVLDVQHNVTGGLDSSDVDLLQMIAAQVAVGLQNARLLTQVQTRAESAARINSISQSIQRATSVEQVLQAAVRELGRALPVNSAHIELETPRPERQWSSETLGDDEPGSANGGH